MSFQASRASINFLDTITSSSEIFFTSSVKVSPSETISDGFSTCRFDNSPIGIIPSDFWPISTRTCFSSTFTSVPSRMLTTSNDLFISYFSNSPSSIYYCRHLTVHQFLFLVYHEFDDLELL